MTAPKLLLVSEVAERLRVCDETVYRMIKRGQLRGYRIGRLSYRVDAASLERLLNPPKDVKPWSRRAIA